MRDFLTLYFAVICGRMGLDGVSNGGGRFKKAVTAVLIVVFGAFFFASFLWLFIPLVRAAHDMEYPALAMDVAVMFSVIPCFWFGFFGILRNVCFAGDIVLLAYLPVRRICIFRSKVAFVYTCCLLSCAAVFVPALAAYSVISGGGIYLWLRGIGVMLALPVIPMTAGAVLGAPLAFLPGSGRFLSAASKNGAKLVIPVIDVVLGILCVVSGSGAEKISSFVASDWALLKSLSIPPFSWAAISVSGGGMTSVITALLLAASVLICWVVLLWILRALFVRRVSKALSTVADRAMS